MSKKKPEVVWEGIDYDGRKRRIVALSMDDPDKNAWLLPEKEAEDAMGKKIWIPWSTN